MTQYIPEPEPDERATDDHQTDGHDTDERPDSPVPAPSAEGRDAVAYVNELEPEPDDDEQRA